jgi:hypothetical protein
VDVAVSSRGFVTFTGQIGNLNDGDLRHASTVVTSQDGEPVNLGGGAYTTPFNRDAFIATYDLGGKLLFAERIGGLKEEVGSGVFFDSAGDLYLSGGFADILTVGGLTLRGKGAINLFLLKYSSNTDSPLPSGPQLVWAKAADNIVAIDPPAGYPHMGITPEGNLLVAGAFSGTTNFDGKTATSAGLTDSFAAEVLSNEPSLSGNSGVNASAGTDNGGSLQEEPLRDESIFDSVSRWFSNTF